MPLSLCFGVIFCHSVQLVLVYCFEFFPCQVYPFQIPITFQITHFSTQYTNRSYCHGTQKRDSINHRSKHDRRDRVGAGPGHWSGRGVRGVVGVGVVRESKGGTALGVVVSE